MGTVNISYGKVGVGGGLGTGRTIFLPVATENLATTTASAPSVGAADKAGNRFDNAVRLVADEDIYVRLGAGTPVAVVGDALVKANQETYFAIKAGERVAIRDVV